MGRLSGGVMLIVVGAILSFAVQVDIPGVGRYTLGIILMLGGLLLVVLFFFMDNQRRRSSTVVEHRPPRLDETVEVVDASEPTLYQRRRRRFLG